MNKKMKAITLPSHPGNYSEPSIVLSDEGHGYGIVDKVTVGDAVRSFTSHNLYIVDPAKRVEEDTISIDSEGNLRYIHKWDDSCADEKVVIATNNPQLRAALYKITPEDIAKWIAAGSPEEVEVEMEACCDMQCDGRCEREGNTILPLITNGYIKLVVKEKGRRQQIESGKVEHKESIDEYYEKQQEIIEKNPHLGKDTSIYSNINAPLPVTEKQQSVEDADIPTEIIKACHDWLMEIGNTQTTPKMSWMAAIEWYKNQQQKEAMAFAEWILHDYSMVDKWDDTFWSNDNGIHLYTTKQLYQEYLKQHK